MSIKIVGQPLRWWLLASFMLFSESFAESFTIPGVYQNVIDQNYRTSYTRLTGYEFSGLHWNQWIAIYINKDADVYKNNYLAYVQAYVDEDEEEEVGEIDFQPYSEGTIFLKEHYQNKEDLPETALTTVMMIKREKGYDPEGGDWEYLQASNDGQIIMSGDSSDATIKSQCQDCHANMAERDYVFSTYYSSSQ